MHHVILRWGQCGRFEAAALLAAIVLNPATASSSASLHIDLAGVLDDVRLI